MTPFSVVAILICIATIGLTWKRRTNSRLLIFVVLLIFHTGASIAYYFYSLTLPADAHFYYYDQYHLATKTFQLGTIGLVNFVQFFRHMGATYLDCFVIFQTFGFAGLMIMSRVFDEIEEHIMVPVHDGALALLFLPTMNFWTAAIGKDGPLFFGISLCVWAMVNLRKRLLFFCISLGVMVLFRAHIAFMAATALATAALFDASVSTGRKAGLLVIALTGVWLTTGAVQTTFGVNATSVSDVSNFLIKQNSIWSTIGGTTSLGNASIPVRVISLFFRPFFFDAHGMMGIVPSFENVGVVIAFIYMVALWRDVAHLAHRVLFIRFVIFFAAILLFSLTLVYYNVGLGLRERLMAYPMILSLLVALWSMRRKRAAPPVPQVDPSLLAAGNRNRAVPEV